MTIKELKKLLNQFIKDFHLTEDTTITVSKGKLDYNLQKVFPILIDGHVKINFELSDELTD